MKHVVHNLVFCLEHVKDSSSSNQDLVIDNAVLVRSEYFDDYFSIMLMEK